jgi:hypothetical protein
LFGWQVVVAQMEALQRSDYPDPGAGLQTAFEFALPAQLLPHVRKWLNILAALM